MTKNYYYRNDQSNLITRSSPISFNLLQTELKAIGLMIEFLK